MLIDNIDSLTFVMTDDEETGLMTIELTDPSGPTVVGTFRIAKPKADAFLGSLKILAQEIHGVFEESTKATTRLDNKISGTIDFRD